MLKLNNLSSSKGANRNKKRIGRGQGSGQGTQAGKGHKGQKARSGGGVRPGFEGGNMPLYMRLPKRNVFSNARFKKEFVIVNLGDLDAKFADGEVVTVESLLERKLISSEQKKLPVKVLGEGEFSKKLTFKGIKKFSKSATEAITKCGSSVEG